MEDLTLQELTKRERTLTYLLYFALGIITLYGMVMMYMMSVGQWNGRYYLIIVPVFVTFMAIIISVLRKLVHEELRKREQEHSKINP